MQSARVIIVHLRRPRLSDPDERRSDPFWEYGSFGLTGCHSRNLMNPKKSSELNDTRFAFAQGGKLGMKLVFISPPIKIAPHERPCEATWRPVRMPFSYSAAPLLIGRDGDTEFPLFKRFLKGTDRGSWLGKFSSRFRSRRQPVETKLSEELVRVYERERRSASQSRFARDYVDALPYPPPKEDSDRELTYSELLAAAREKHLQGCKRKRRGAVC